VTSHRFRLLTVTVALSAVLLSGCATPTAPTAAGGSAVTVKDCQGKDVTFADSPKRVVAIDGWAAQSMAHLGLADRIVGVGFPGPLTAEPEPYRSEVAKIPVLSEKSMPVTETVAALRPDTVVTGFSSFGGAPGSAKDADLATMGAQGVAACQPGGMTGGTAMTDLSATYDFIIKLGKIFRVTDRADKLVSDLRAREQAAAAKATGSPRVRVLTLAENPAAGQPVKALGGGTISNAITLLAGGQNIFDDVGSMHADVSPEKVADLDPQVIWVVTDFSFAKTTGQQLVDSIKANPLLASTTAVKQGRILSTSQYLVGAPTPLNLDGLDQLASGLHPVSP